MQVAICSAVFGRVPLTAVWWRSIDRIRRAFARHGITATAIVGGHEPEHRILCAQHDGRWVETPNFPVGAKWNAVATAALSTGAEYLWCLGSDDFFSDEIIERYAISMQAGWLHLGTSGVYVYDLATDQVMSWFYNERGRYVERSGAGITQRLVIQRPETRTRYRETVRLPDGRSITTSRYSGYQPGDGAGLPIRAPLTLGAGRALHKSLFAGHQYYWAPDQNSRLDSSLSQNLKPPHAGILFPGPNALVVDVKTPDSNIWSFAQLYERMPEALLPDSQVLHSLPEWAELQQLRSSYATAQGQEKHRQEHQD